MSNKNLLSSEIQGDDIDALGLREQEKKYKNERLNAENERYRHDTADRKKLTNWLKDLIPFYLGAVFLLLYFSSMLKLDTSVLNTLLTTTTANLLGMMYIVLKGYFPSSKK